MTHRKLDTKCGVDMVAILLCTDYLAHPGDASIDMRDYRGEHVRAWDFGRGTAIVSVGDDWYELLYRQCASGDIALWCARASYHVGYMIRGEVPE